MTYSFDFIQAIAFIMCLLLAIGIIPFTAGWVATIIILSMCNLKITSRHR